MFMIGIDNTIYDLLPLDDIFTPVGDVFDPDWSFQDFAVSVDLGNGLKQGQGFPIAIWRFNQLSNANRQVLKTLCPGLSAEVYIQTKTNELDGSDLEWKVFKCIMNWTPEDEDKQANRTLAVVLTFTHLEEQI